MNVKDNYLVSMLCSWFILCRHLQFDAKADNVNINIYFAFSVYYYMFLHSDIILSMCIVFTFLLCSEALLACYVSDNSLQISNLNIYTACIYMQRRLEGS